MAPPSFTIQRGGSQRAGSADAGGGHPGHGVEPRQWQRQLIQLLRARMHQQPTGIEAGPHDVLVHAGPGAGKTLGALLSFSRLRHEQHLDRFVVFCHRSSISDQWLAAARRLHLRLHPWNGGVDLGDADGWLLSYQSAGRNRQQLQQLLQQPQLGRWLAIADEVHHLGLDPEEPEAAAWGAAFSQLTTPARLRLGLTGTPFRADNLAFCAARRVRRHLGDRQIELISPDLSVEPRQLIAAGDVRPLEFRFQDGWVDHGRGTCAATGAGLGETETSPLSAELRESWRARNLRRAIQLGDPSSIALQVLLKARRRLERVRQEHPGAGGLVIARNIDHATSLGALLREQGDRVLLVHSQDPEAAARLAAFQRGAGDWLVSVDMCAEGFDASRLRVLAYLTTVVTRSRFVQAITRVVRMDGERAAHEPIPRQPSYVFAPADPLLMGFARSWSLSEPYLIDTTPRVDEPPDGAFGSASSVLPLQAIEARAGELIRLRGPELPSFLRPGT
jgi:superfamily II DNA or RNA helicase